MFGHTPWMSNLFPDCKNTDVHNAPKMNISYDDRTFASVEGAYQYAKACQFHTQLHQRGYDGGEALRELFPSTIGAWNAKTAAGKGKFAAQINARVTLNGQKVSKKKAGELYDDICKCEGGWFAHSRDVMHQLLRQKFGESHPAFRTLLNSTGDAKLYETATRSGTVWERKVKEGGWGFLGDILMAIREEIREAD